MDYFRELIELVVRALKQMRHSYTRELQDCPEGGLVYNLNHKRNRYYHSSTVDGKYKRNYLSPLVPEQDQMISQLARKEYLKKSLPLIDRNIAQLERALSKYSPVDPGSVLPMMKNAYQYLNADRFFETARADSLHSQILHELSSYEELGRIFMESDDYLQLRLQDHRQWAAEPYERNTHDFGDTQVFASDGTRVRSRAEAFWYDKLQLFDVPFKLDKMTFFGEDPDTGFWRAPDFTFEDANYEEFYLEYCGMMDDPGYVASHLIKRQQYERVGVVPWKNIIYDYAEGNSFDAGKIESIIRYQIIPRL